jgi:hypothetical protein
MIFPEGGDRKYLQHIVVRVELAPIFLVKSRGSKHCLFRRCMILFMDLDGLSDPTVQESQRCVNHAFPHCELRGLDALQISLSLFSLRPQELSTFKHPKVHLLLRSLSPTLAKPFIPPSFDALLSEMHFTKSLA